MGKKKDYWGKQQDLLCEIIKNTKSEADRWRAYKKLEPALMYMITSIIDKYSDFPVMSVYDDILTKVLETIPKFDEKRNTKWYSYLQTIARNRLIDHQKKIVYKGYNSSRYDYIEDLDEDYKKDIEDIVEEKFEDFTYLLKKELFRQKEEAKKRIVKRIEDSLLLKKKMPTVKKDYERIVVIYKIIEFLEKYGKTNYGRYDLLNYVVNNVRKIPEEKVITHFSNIFVERFSKDIFNEYKKRTND